MRASDIMTPNPRAVTPGDTTRTAAGVMRDLDVGAVPVVADLASMRLEGVLTDRDIAVRCVAAGHHDRCRVEEHMTSGPLATVHPDDDVADVLALMERERVRRVPVVTDGTRLTGIIAQADIAMRLGPNEPRVVEQLLERVSEPQHAPR
ncbi:MAG TPA: CBS domain-containing protein [Gemmatimonadaceae bacterium]